MPTQWNSLFIAISILVLAIPYVAYIRHPRQKKLATYFVFLITFVVSAAAIFILLLWSISYLGVTILLSDAAPASIFIVAIVLPALVFATWLAKKAP